MASSIVTLIVTSLIVFLLSCSLCVKAHPQPLPVSDVDLLEFPLNLEYLEAEFFLYGALGRGLDAIAPNLTMGGPPPIGVKKAKLNPLIRDVILQFALQEVGHLRYTISHQFL